MIELLFWFCAFVTLYVYLGYPLLLTGLASLKPKVKPYPPCTPTATLLIAAYNEEVVIAEKLENSLALDYPRERIQILVVADGSDDRTPDVVQGYAARGVELTYAPARRGKTAAINRAMVKVRGEIVVFSDANNMYTPNALRELVAPFSDATVGAVSGAKIVSSEDGTLGESEGIYWTYESYIKQQETLLGCTTGFSGEILALRRELFEPPPVNTINDDFYAAMQIIRRGYRVVYAPQARSYERVSLSAQDEMTRRVRINAGWFQSMASWRALLPWRQPVVVWQVASHKFLRPCIPMAMLGLLVTNILAVLFPASCGNAMLCLETPFNWVFLAAQVIFCLLAFIGNRIEQAGYRKLPLCLYLPTFFVNNNLAALIGLYRFLTGRQTTLWQRVPRQKGAVG